MAYEIIYTKRFSHKLFKLLDYLRSEWGEPVADKFIIELKNRLRTLSEHPFIGTPSLVIQPVRSILITKHSRIFYRIKGNQIEIINMYDTRSNPKKNKYL